MPVKLPSIYNWQCPSYQLEMFSCLLERHDVFLQVRKFLTSKKSMRSTLIEDLPTIKKEDRAQYMQEIERWQTLHKVGYLLVLLCGAVSLYVLRAVLVSVTWIEFLIRN